LRAGSIEAVELALKSALLPMSKNRRLPMDHAADAALHAGH
jgi:hypothetical protein